MNSLKSGSVSQVTTHREVKTFQAFAVVLLEAWKVFNEKPLNEFEFPASISALYNY